MPEIVQLITRLPRNERAQFKAACAARGATMRSVVLAAVRREIEKFQKGKK